MLAPISSPPKDLARPKSDIFGFILESSNILLALRSRWITRRQESWWRYIRPRAIPLIILKRLGQSSDMLSMESAKAVWKSDTFSSEAVSFYIIVTERRKTYRKELSPDFYWSCIHKPTSSLLLECNILEVSLDSDAEVLQYRLLHSWIHLLLEVTFLIVVSQQFPAPHLADPITKM